MLITYVVKDEATQVELHRIPWIDYDFHEGSTYKHNGITYKVESTMLELESYGGTQGLNPPGYHEPICEVFVTVVP